MGKVGIPRGHKFGCRTRFSAFQLAAMERCFQQYHLNKSVLNENVKHSTHLLAEKLDLPEETLAVCATFFTRILNSLSRDGFTTVGQNGESKKE